MHVVYGGSVGQRSSVPLLWHRTGVSFEGCAAAARSASVSELARQRWVTVAALAVTAKRDARRAVASFVCRGRCGGEKSALTWEDLCVCGRLWGREARPAAASRFFFFEFLQPTLSLWHSPLYGLGRFNSFNQSFSVILFIHCTTGVKCLQGCTLAGMLKLITLFLYLCCILGGLMSGLCMRISIGRSCFERKIQ